MSNPVSSEASGDHPAHQQSDRLQRKFVCIKRPNANLTAIFEHMYLNERLVDVTLSCEDGQLQAHRLVLAACSPYFSNVFDKLPNQYQYPVIVIKDMQLDDLKLLVEFMYRGHLIIDHQRLNDLVKCAENLKITGLSSLDTLITSPVDKKDFNQMITINVDGPEIHVPVAVSHRSMLKRAKRSTSSSINHQVIFTRTYQRSFEHDDTYDLQRPSAEKLLEQSVSGANDDLDVGGQFSNTNYSISSNSSNYPMSTKNLVASQSHNFHNTTSNGNSNHDLTHVSPVSSLQHIQHQLAMDNNQLGTNSGHQQTNQNLSTQLHVLSQSLAANRTSSNINGASNSQSNNNSLAHSMSPPTANSDSSSPHAIVRGRLHACHICWKTFREKANLKRHLQVHSTNRVVYACRQCNKTFSWKDNFIRHTKTSHNMIDLPRPQ